jgi:hypothetical protein
VTPVDGDPAELAATAGEEFVVADGAAASIPVTAKAVRANLTHVRTDDLDGTGGAPSERGN